MPTTTIASPKLGKNIKGSYLNCFLKSSNYLDFSLTGSALVWIISTLQKEFRSCVFSGQKMLVVYIL